MQANRSAKRAPRSGAKKKSTTSRRGSARQGSAKSSQPREGAKPNQPREGSVLWAAMQVLRGKREPMNAAEIYAEIRTRNLAPNLKGKTPEQTVAARLAVAAKSGVHVQRTAPGKFKLKR
jgi:hypothetical protein